MAVRDSNNEVIRINKDIFQIDYVLETSQLLRQHGLKYDIGKRELECLLRYNNYYHSMNFTHGSILSKDQYLANLIKSNIQKEDLCKVFIHQIQTKLININNFPLLNPKDHRQTLNLIYLLFKDINLSTYSSSSYQNLIHSLDNLDWDIEQKNFKLNQALMMYNDKKLAPKTLKWIDRDNNIQILWAIDYLKNHNVVSPNYFLYSITNEEKYQAVLAGLDILAYWPPESMELFLLKMKKTWSQKKFRDSGKAKKLYHLPLSESTQKKLEQLAIFHNSNKAATLERLINHEYDRTNF